MSGRTLRSEHRYSEFRHLYSQLQLLSPCPPLPPFPKPVLLPLKPSVIAQRKGVLETYLKYWARDDQTRPTLWTFLGVSEQTFEEIVRKKTEEALNDGEASISSLHTRLSREAYNRFQILTEFDQAFFEIKHHIRPEYLQCLLTAILPLCGDVVCGPKALMVVDKMLERGRVASTHEFKLALVKTPVSLLSQMLLDRHLVGEFTGDSRSEAYFISSLLYDSLPISSFLSVLNHNDSAFDHFRSWTDGKLFSNCSGDVCPRKASEDWLVADCSHYPGLAIKHKSELSGCLQLSVTMFVRASVERVAECVLNTDCRATWDKWMKQAQFVKWVSTQAWLTFFTFEYDHFSVSVLCFIEKVCENGKVRIEYRRVTEPEMKESQFRECPLISIYILEEGKNPSELVSLSEGEGMSEIATIPLEAKLRPEEEGNGCILRYSAMHTSEFRRLLVEDLIGEREVMKEVWWSLKQAAENHPLPTPSPHVSLSLACDQKLLGKLSRHKSVK